MFVSLLFKEENLIEVRPVQTRNFVTRNGGTEFVIRVLFRQNSSWQGEVHWLEADRKIYFRSLLELIMLLQEAMDCTDSLRAEYWFYSWKNEKIIAYENTK